MRGIEKAGAFFLASVALVGILATFWTVSDAQVPPSPSAMNRNDPVANETIKLKSHQIRASDGGTSPHVFTAPGRIGYDPEQQCITLYTGDGGWKRVCPGSGSGSGADAGEWRHSFTDAGVLRPVRGEDEAVLIGPIAAAPDIHPFSMLDVRHGNANIWTDRVCSSAEACPTPPSFSNSPYLLTLTNTLSSGLGDTAILFRTTGDPEDYYTSGVIGVTASATAAWSSGLASGRLSDMYFITRDGSSNLHERMRIYGDSFATKVAIGVNGGSPGGSTLSVRGGFAMGNTYYTTNAGSGTALVEIALGIGTTSPTAEADIVGGVQAHSTGVTAINTYLYPYRSTRAIASGQHFTLNRTGGASWSIGTVHTADDFAIGPAQATDSNFTAGNAVFRALSGTTASVTLSAALVTLSNDAEVTDDLLVNGDITGDATLTIDGQSTLSGHVAVGNLGTGKQLQLFEPTPGLNYTEINALAQASDILYNLPTAQAGGANFCLLNDGSGNLSWSGTCGTSVPGGGLTVSPAYEHINNVTFFTGATTVSGDDDLHWDNTNKRLGVGTAGIAPTALLSVGTSSAFQIDTAGRVFAPVGATGAGNLSYSFVGDTNTGMYRSASDQITYETGGLNSLVIDGVKGVKATSTTGSWWLGTTHHLFIASDGGVMGLQQNSSIAGASLNMYDNASAVQAVVQWANSGAGDGSAMHLRTVNAFPIRMYTSGTQAMHIDASQNVGIGSTSPSDRLEVSGTANTILGERIRNLSAGASAYATLYLGSASATTDVVLFTVGTGNSAYGGARSGGIGTNTAVPFVFITAGTEKVRVEATGEFRLFSISSDPTGTNGEIYYNSVSNKFRCFEASAWTDCIGSGAPAFSAITSGTNTIAAMVVGTGASLTFSGSGTVNASSLLNKTWAIPDPIGATTPNTGAFTSLSGTTLGVSGAVTFSSFSSNGGPLYTNGIGTVAQVTAGTTTQVLHGGTTPSFSAVSLTADVSGTLPVASGGTGATTLTGLLVGNGTSPVTSLGSPANGQIPIGDGDASPTYATLTAGTNITVTNGAGSITLSATSNTIGRVTTAVNYTVLSTDYYVGATANGITMALPAAATAGNGRVYVFKDQTGTASSNCIVLDPNGAELIDGAATYSLCSDYQAVNVVSDGSAWWVW